jgi:hypothetical protein
MKDLGGSELTAEELEAEQGTALPDREEMSFLLGPQPLPPTLMPVDGTATSYPVPHPPTPVAEPDLQMPG